MQQPDDGSLSLGVLVQGVYGHPFAYIKPRTARRREYGALLSNRVRRKSPRSFSLGSVLFFGPDFFPRRDLYGGRAGFSVRLHAGINGEIRRAR